MEKRLGEEVRGSIHNAIDKINKVSEVTLSVGIAITSESSPTTGFYEGSVYLNSSTYELWVCNGYYWESAGTIKGIKGDRGNNGLSILGLEENTDDKTFRATLSDGSATNWIPLLAGEKGEKGDKGNAGTAGLSVIMFRDQPTGAIHNYSAIMSDGSEIPVGSIKDGVMQGGGMTKDVYAKEDPNDEGYVDKALSLVDKQGNVVTTETIRLKANHATSLQGYEIADAYTKDEVDGLIGDKANKATSLAGYGITDAYTKTQVDSKVTDSIGNVVADAFSYSRSYTKGDYAIYNESLYRCKLDCQGQDIRDTIYWEQVKMADVLASLNSAYTELNGKIKTLKTEVRTKTTNKSTGAVTLDGDLDSRVYVAIVGKTNGQYLNIIGFGQTNFWYSEVRDVNGALQKNVSCSYVAYYYDL